MRSRFRRLVTTDGSRASR